MEDEGSAGRSKGDETSDSCGIQSPEQRLTAPASELQAARCGRSVSPQRQNQQDQQSQNQQDQNQQNQNQQQNQTQQHSELDSDVSEDTDQELDIEDDGFTLNH